MNIEFLKKSLESWMRGHSVEQLSDDAISIDKHTIEIHDKFILIDGIRYAFNGSVRNFMLTLERSNFIDVNFRNLSGFVAATYLRCKRESKINFHAQIKP